MREQSKKAKQYELTTIQDIFEKVPADRIQTCCEELGHILTQCKIWKDLADAVSSPESTYISFPITWIDDDKGELTTNLYVDGIDEPVGAIKVTLK